MGAPKAITATAHKLARIIYSMLRYGQAYVDAGAEYYERRYHQRALRTAKRRAAQLGLPTGSHVRRRGPHHVRTSRRANRRVTMLVSGEQRYGRGRPMQRRLTGQSASAVYTLARRVVRTKTE